MNIGIIGTGRMGEALGRLAARKGHAVLFGSRDPARLHGLVEECGHDARCGTYAQAAAFAKAVFLTVPWHAAEETIKGLGPLSGKILVDCTNPLGRDLTDLVVPPGTSAAELVAGWAPGARVVKAFNAIHYGNLADPRFGGCTASLFYCGDDASAKHFVATFGEQLGFAPIDVGPLAMARHLESLALLWVHLAFAQNLGTDTAITLVRR